MISDCLHVTTSMDESQVPLIKVSAIDSSNASHAKHCTYNTVMGLRPEQVQSAGQIHQHQGDHIVLGNIHASTLLNMIFQKSLHQRSTFDTKKDSHQGTSDSLSGSVSGIMNSEVNSPSSFFFLNDGGMLPSSVTENKADSAPFSKELSRRPDQLEVKASNSKPQLLSSDTVILSPVSQSYTEPLSVDRDTTNILTNKPCSLIPNISDRYVSLQSIPSSSVFNPSVSDMPDVHKDNIVHLPSQDSCLTSVSNEKHEHVPMILEEHSSIPESEVNVLGSNIPQSILHIIGKQSKRFKTSNSQTAIRSEDEDRCDSENGSGNIHSKPFSIKNEDTVILESEENMSIPVTQFSQFSPTTQCLQNSKSNEISATGSLTATYIPATSFSVSVDNSCLTRNSSPLSKEIVGPGLSSSDPQTASDSQSTVSVPLSAFLSSSSRTSSNNIYFDLSDGHAPMLRCQSGDLLDVSNLFRISPHVIDTNQGSSSVSSRLMVKQILAKETQTDIVLGTNDIDIQTDKIRVFTTAAASTTTHLQSTNIPSTVIMSESTTTTNSPSLSQHLCHATNQTACSSNAYPHIESQSNVQNETVELQHDEKNSKKKFKCDLCNATFTRMGNFTRHRKIHNLQSEVSP